MRGFKLGIFTFERRRRGRGRKRRGGKRGGGGEAGRGGGRGERRGRVGGFGRGLFVNGRESSFSKVKRKKRIFFSFF